MLRSEIVGSIKMRVFLSGMPELRLGLNDKVLFDNTGREYPRTVQRLDQSCPREVASPDPKGMLAQWDGPLLSSASFKKMPRAAEVAQ